MPLKNCRYTTSASDLPWQRPNASYFFPRFGLTPSGTPKQDGSWLIGWTTSYRLMDAWNYRQLAKIEWEAGFCPAFSFLTPQLSQCLFRWSTPHHSNWKGQVWVHNRKIPKNTGLGPIISVCAVMRVEIMHHNRSALRTAVMFWIVLVTAVLFEMLVVFELVMLIWLVMTVSLGFYIVLTTTHPVLSHRNARTKEGNYRCYQNNLYKFRFHMNLLSVEICPLRRNEFGNGLRIIDHTSVRGKKHQFHRLAKKPIRWIR